MKNIGRTIENSCKARVRYKTPIQMEIFSTIQVEVEGKIVDFINNRTLNSEKSSFV